MARKVSNGNLGAGATITQDVAVGGSEWLTVIATVGPTATASGDAVLTVNPFLDDANDAAGGTPTLSDAVLTADAASSTAAALTNNRAVVVSRFRVSGIRKVRITLKNNNAGALPASIDFGTG